MEQYIGKILNDRYEILEVLGVGGMAVVYKAKCHRLNRMVAVKILKPELAADPEIRSRFHDESKAVGMMSHPNIVNVYDVNQDGDTDYFVMELVEGITLKQYIKKRGGVLNWREALHFSVQILHGLSHAHSRGIIHRDIKPQNIMVLRDGSVKVADFGIAHIADSQKTMTQEALGSVHYISPEQARGSEIDQRSDLYSVGVVLYEMLTGRLPYEGDSPVAVAVQHINSIPLAPRELNPEIPVGMEQITMRAMAQDRELRYADAAAMLADLDAFRRNPNTVFDYQNPWMLTELKDIPAYDEGTEQQPADPQEEDDDEEEDEGGGHRTLLLIIGVVVLILVVIGFIFRMLWASLFAGLLDTGTEYTVPDLKGLTYAEAEEEILTNQELNGHFTVTVSDETAYNADYEPGEILYQDPEGGTKTKSEQTEITVILCAEEKEEASELVMPDIVGKDYAVWADTLSEQYNVVVKYIQEYSSDYKEGKIISTDPVAGETLQEGQTVTITYSKGEKITTVTMISLIGMTESEAKSALTDMGLSCGTVVTVASDEEKGTVVFQSVNSGDEVEPGTEVDLQISTGPQPEDEEEPEEDVQDPEEDAQEPEEDQDDQQQSDSQMESDTQHTIIVYLPDGRTENVNLSIKVNGVNFYSGTCKPEDSLFTTEYNGSITSIEVTLDGASYHEYDVQ